MIAEENKQWGNLSPETLGGSLVHLCLYVEKVDEVFARALKEGGRPSVHQALGSRCNRNGYAGYVLGRLLWLTYRQVWYSLDGKLHGKIITSENHPPR